MDAPKTAGLETSATPQSLPNHAVTVLVRSNFSMRYNTVPAVLPFISFDLSPWH